MVKKIFFASLMVLLLGTFAHNANANHSWGGYHWARTANPFTLKLGDNLSSAWKTFLTQSSTDWSVSSVLDTTIVLGTALRSPSPQKDCSPVSGTVQVCNRTYGNNGWLGIAQIWVNGLHITQGTTKMNDTYFNTSKYNTSAWRQFVICQEVGHTFGLDHQDTTFNNTNLGTCMDYTNDPTGTLGTNGTLDNEHPNAHDYDELGIIYSHLDSTTTVSSSSTNGRGKGSSSNVGENIDLNDPSAWGKAIRQDAHGNNSLYESDLGNNKKLFTFVTWAE